MSVNIDRLYIGGSRTKMKQEQVKQAKESSDERESPRFGRLLLVLLFAVALIVVITFATEAYYTN
jgi:hypothetical protein